MLTGYLCRHNQDDGEYGQHGEKIASEVSSVDQCGTGQLLKKECQLADDEDNDITPRGQCPPVVTILYLETTQFMSMLQTKKKQNLSYPMHICSN